MLQSECGSIYSLIWAMARYIIEKNFIALAKSYLTRFIHNQITRK